MNRSLALPILIALISAAGEGHSQVIHRTQAGDTLGSLAERYYGDAGLADLISRHNGIGKALKPGVELRLPSASTHQVARGESWSDLAARYWGEAAAGPELARWCGSDGTTAPVQGRVLAIPALAKHRIEPGETLVALARRFYRDPEKAADLARLNRIKDPRRLRAGTAVRVPFFGTVRSERAAPVQAAAAPSPAPTRGDVPSAPQRRGDPLGADLSGAVNAYLDGNFEDALARLEEQRPRVLASGSPDQRGLLLRYLIFSYVAFDRDDAACEAFSTLRKSGADAALDPELVSPKIRGVLDQCATP